MGRIEWVESASKIGKVPLIPKRIMMPRRHSHYSTHWASALAKTSELGNAFELKLELKSKSAFFSLFSVQSRLGWEGASNQNTEKIASHLLEHLRALCHGLLPPALALGLQQLLLLAPRQQRLQLGPAPREQLNFGVHVVLKVNSEATKFAHFSRQKCDICTPHPNRHIIFLGKVGVGCRKASGLNFFS